MDHLQTTYRCSQGGSSFIIAVLENVEGLQFGLSWGPEIADRAGSSHL